MTIRLTKIDDGHWLDSSDQCYYIGEYISGGTWKASDTNQLTSNLKADVRAKPQRAQHKTNAVAASAGQLFSTLSGAYLRDKVTVVPMPCSKPSDHADYDDRMERVVRALGRKVGDGFDGRAILRTANAREAQHIAGARASIRELAASMTVDRALLITPLRPIVIVLDDVFTLGASFKAAQLLLKDLPGVKEVAGVFLARTTWLPVNIEDAFPDL